MKKYKKINTNTTKYSNNKDVDFLNSEPRGLNRILMKALKQSKESYSFLQYMLSHIIMYSSAYVLFMFFDGGDTETFKQLLFVPIVVFLSEFLTPLLREYKKSDVLRIYAVIIPFILLWSTLLFTVFSIEELIANLLLVQMLLTLIYIVKVINLFNTLNRGADKLIGTKGYLLSENPIKMNLFGPFGVLYIFIILVLAISIVYTVYISSYINFA